MGPGSKAGPGDVCRNIARKSTGAQVYLIIQYLSKLSSFLLIYLSDIFHLSIIYIYLFVSYLHYVFLSVFACICLYLFVYVSIYLSILG